MKKKILTVILCGILLVGLTGCKQQKKNEVNLEDSKSNLVMAFSDKDNLMVIKEGMTQDNGYIVDYDGNNKGTISYAYDGSTYIMNGYVYTTSTNDMSYVYDSTGKEVYSVKGKITGVSENGYALVEEKKSDMSSGDHIEYNIINLKNSESIHSYEKDVSGKIIYSGYKDYFLETKLNAMDSGNLYDAKDQKEYREYSTNKEYLSKESNILQYLKVPYENGEKGTSGTSILSFENKLFLKEGKIYDFNEKELKDISEGQIRYINYYNDNIFVVTYTGYIYTMDKNFNYIAKPVKYSDTDLDKVLSLPTQEEHFNKELTSSSSQLYTTTSGYYYVDISSGKAKIEIYDNDTFKKVKSVEVEINDSKDIKVTDYGIIVDSSDDNVYFYSKNNEKVYKDSSIKNYSKRMVNIFIDSAWETINLSTLKKINIK